MSLAIHNSLHMDLNNTNNCEIYCEFGRKVASTTIFKLQILRNSINKNLGINKTV